MILFDKNPFTKNQIICAAFCLMTLLAFFIFFFGYRPTDKEITSPHLKKEVKAETLSLNSGPLALTSGYTTTIFDEIRKQLSFASLCLRPKKAQDPSQVLIGLSAEEKLRAFPLKRRIFLSPIAEGKFSFSDKPSSICFTPQEATEKEVRVVVEVQIPSKDNSFVWERREFILPLQEKKDVEIENKKAYTELSGAHFYGKDAFFQLYGGKKYRHLADAAKIVLNKQNEGSKVFFLGKNSILAFQKGFWQEIEEEKLTTEIPIASLEKLSDKEVVINFWDKERFTPHAIKLPIETSKEKISSFEADLKEMRLRTHSKVSARLQGRRVVLKEGDWWIKIDEKWHNLKELKEIESFIEQRIEGTLFVFDKVEKKDKKQFLSGHLFDPMRSYYQKVFVPITKIEKQETPRSTGPRKENKTALKEKKRHFEAMLQQMESFETGRYQSEDAK